MTNLKLSLVAGYPVEAPGPSDYSASPPFASIPAFSTSLLKRTVDWFRRTERNREEAEAARFIRGSGGVLTDEIERQIGLRYGK
jgi:hypothetical protein